MSATGSRGEDGFTLIECLAVLAITVMVAAMAFPVLQRAMSAAAMSRSKTTLLAEFQQARARAFSGGAPVALSVSDDGTAYGWTGEAARATPPQVRVRVASHGPIAFYPDGSANGGLVSLWSGPRLAVIGVSPAGVVTVVDPRTLRAGGS